MSRVLIFQGLMFGSLDKFNENLDKAEIYFKENDLPSGRVVLNACETVFDSGKMVESHIAVLRASKGSRRVKAFWLRLKMLKDYIERNKQSD